MNALQIYQYKGFDIEFEIIDGQVYANATVMCRAFDKRASEWARLPATMRYAEALKAKWDNPTSLTISSKGGLTGGSTWIHEKLILKLVQWLDVDFEIRCDQMVAQLITTSRQLLPDFTNPVLAARAWADQVELRTIAEGKQQMLLAENAQLKPKADYADKVLTSTDELTTTFIANELAMSAIALNKRLHKEGIQYKQSGTWMLYTKYLGHNYAAMRTFPYTDSKGRPRTEHYLVWTETGRAFIHKLLNQELAPLPLPLSGGPVSHIASGAGEPVSTAL